MGATSRAATTCDERKTAGAICESCELLSTCVKHTSGWVNIPVETCDTEKGFYCNAQLGMCSNQTGPCHPFGAEGNFPCTSHGIFPDPYDCQKYHMCYFVSSTLVSATVDCGGSTAFDASTGRCSLTLQDPSCQREQFHCSMAGEAHAWPSSPNIFYICKATSNGDERILFPALYRCADGEIFDGYTCRTNSSTPPVSTTTYDPWNPTQPTTTSTPSTGQCTQVGLLPDRQDCHKYYYCSAINGVMKHFECPAGTYYNPGSSACRFGNCIN